MKVGGALLTLMENRTRVALEEIEMTLSHLYKSMMELLPPSTGGGPSNFSNETMNRFSI